VNLIGDHTDYLGGLALPMAVDLGTRVAGTRGGDEVVLRSEAVAGVVRLPCRDALAAVQAGTPTIPKWGRYVAGVIDEVDPATGFEGVVSSTVPVGSGLSSSAALEVALALALGAPERGHDLARLCQRAEQRASGVPCGIMDQLASVAGVAGHALLVDFADLSVTPVAVPDDAEVVVVHSGQSRTLDGSAYAERRAQCETAETRLGPLRQLVPDEVGGNRLVAALGDETLARRARHVVTENDRVRRFAVALAAGDLVAAGALMAASHASLRDDFAVSTTVLDAVVERLSATPGVHGARLTGAGFGGCVVALCDPGVLHEGWVVHAAAGAHLI
jgi:galactokinase